MRSFLLFLLILMVAGCSKKRMKSAAAISPKHTTDSVTGVFPSDTVYKETAVKPTVNDTIIPGRSVGLISINEKAEDVIRVLGQPDSSDAAMGKALLSWFSKPNAKDTAVNSVRVFAKTNFGAKDEASRVRLIRITSPFFKTETGVSTGNTLMFIKTKYPDIKKWASYDNGDDKPVIIYLDMKEGISFEICGTTKCIGIAVHQKNETAWELYNAVFGTIKKS